MAEDKKPELYQAPAVVKPSMDELQAISTDLKLKCTQEELETFHEMFSMTCKSYQIVNQLPEPQLPVGKNSIPFSASCYFGKDDVVTSWNERVLRNFDRPSSHRYVVTVYWRCEIKGAEEGILKGKTVGIKDSIPVAGVPMMDGSKILEGYTPEFDATVVTKVLDAGGTILGKAVCEDLCHTGSSWSSSTGPVKNPHDKTISSGGSSSGCASLVARGKIDIAIGGDQGGSVRTPASACGIVGLKPTFGSVPYTGAVSMEVTIDHLGPMARTLEDGISCKRIGLLREGFEGAEPEVDRCVREAAKRLTESGATVEEVSIPAHNQISAVHSVVALEGAYACMTGGNAGHQWQGHYPTSLQEALTRGSIVRPHDQPLTVKMMSLWSEYVKRNYQCKFYGKAQNIRRALVKAYDDVLKEYDGLIMPTLPMKPLKLPTVGCSTKELLQLSFGMITNTAHFNITGHPALSIDTGLSEDHIPVGMMIIGRKFDDMTVLQIARAYEKIRDGE
ncbi:hypothetical protein KUTeg_020668 [Tegillarca granosa]|uniref:Amidase domain-containing protein n=1 Tax=Tegillarca granosa TaxID=220873 RepID=A0ABQ9EBC5_TEGGR|nr:hypothetical protein KUTeg_020668 [Tegillarca granosa]